MLAHPLEDLDRADDGEGAAADADVALDDGVLQAQLERVDAQLDRQLVQERLEREGGGRRSGAPVGAEREPVRLDAVAAEVVGLPPVRACDEERRDALHAPAGVRAAVDDHAGLDPGQRPVLAASDAEMRDLRGCGVRRLEVLRTGEHEPHRPSEDEAAPAASGSTSANLPPKAPPSGSATT